MDVLHVSAARAALWKYTAAVIGRDGRAPLIHALMDLQGKRTFFVRIINCQQGELKPGDKVKLAVFDVDTVPQETGRGSRGGPAGLLRI